MASLDPSFRETSQGPTSLLSVHRSFQMLGSEQASAGSLTFCTFRPQGFRRAPVSKGEKKTKKKPEGPQSQSELHSPDVLQPQCSFQPNLLALNSWMSGLDSTSPSTESHLSPPFLWNHLPLCEGRGLWEGQMWGLGSAREKSNDVLEAHAFRNLTSLASFLPY